MNKLITTFMVIMIFALVFSLALSGYMFVKWINWKISYEPKVEQCISVAMTNHINQYHGETK